jgi:hypothetical protein
MKPWLSKKMKELLGDDVPDLVSLILKRLANKASPLDIMEKISNVFEEETEVRFLVNIQGFVMKLWASLIYEILKAERLQTLTLTTGASSSD